MAAATGTRTEVRDHLRRTLEELVEPRIQRVVENDGWANVPVITERDFRDAITAAFTEPIGQATNKSAEVATPATVKVWAECPECGVAAAILVTVGAELLVTADGKELRIKAKAKARQHSCGVADPENAQLGAFDDEDLDEAEDDIDEGEDAGPLLLEAGDEAEPEPGEEPEAAAAPDEPGETLECVGSNHVPGCEHMGGRIPPARPAVSP